MAEVIRWHAMSQLFPGGDVNKKGSISEYVTKGGQHLWRYRFDASAADGKRTQVGQAGFSARSEAVTACELAIARHEKGKPDVTTNVTEREQPDVTAIAARLSDFRKEIDRRRKENHEKRNARNWNPEPVIKLELIRILDWIEEELEKISAEA